MTTVVLHHGAAACEVTDRVSIAQLNATAHSTWSLEEGSFTLLDHQGRAVQDERSLQRAEKDCSEHEGSRATLHLHLVLSAILAAEGSHEDACLAHLTEEDVAARVAAEGGAFPTPLCAGDEEGLTREMSFEDVVEMEAETPFCDAVDRPAAASVSACDVLVIGGGPVGLWVALQTKLLSPSTAVHIIEKHAQYQRSHVVQLQKASLQSRAVDTPELKALCDSFPYHVRTNALEDGLSRLAVAAGVTWDVRAVEDVSAEVRRLRPKTVVGADGSHSLTRRWLAEATKEAPRWWDVKKKIAAMSSKAEELAADGFEEDEVIERTVHLKYEVDATACTPSALTKMEAYCTSKLLPHRFAIFEGMGKPKDGRAPVTVIFAGVNPEQFATCEQATFRHPMTLEDPASAAVLHPDLRAAMTGWLAAKRQLRGERVVPGTVAISRVPLRVYRCERFAADVTVEGHGQVGAFLVGDAAFGVPFFRALNNGFVCGSRLAELIAAPAPPGLSMASLRSMAVPWAKTTTTAQFDRFERMLAGREAGAARAKAVGLTGGRLFSQYTKLWPLQLQILKLGEEDAAAVLEAVARAIPAPAQE